MNVDYDSHLTSSPTVAMQHRTCVGPQLTIYISRPADHLNYCKRWKHVVHEHIFDAASIYSSPFFPDDLQLIQKKLNSNILTVGRILPSSCPTFLVGLRSDAHKII